MHRVLQNFSGRIFEMTNSLKHQLNFINASFKVIIIEDEEGHFQLMQRAITKGLPHTEIHHFAEAETCLQQMDEIDPHVILVDYLIPGMNGLEFLQALKRADRDVPVVIITGHGDEAIAVQALKLGAVDYLVKSGDFFKLLPGLLTKVIEKCKLEASLRETAQLNELLLNSLPSPALLVGRDGVILAANQKAREIGGRVGGPCLRELCPAKNPTGYCDPTQRSTCIIGEDGRRSLCCLQQKTANRSVEVDAFDSVWEVRSALLDQDKHLIFAIDISRRKRAEEALTVTQRFLKIANQNSVLDPLLQAFVREIKIHVDCHAVGIRLLNEGGNLPYQAHIGFDQRFYELESPLSICSDQCMCIHVIRGTTDCKLPFYTKSGSFYMNRTTHFLANLSEGDKRATRNVCNRQGYESVALIPIPLRNRIIGLIHIADRQEDKIPLFVVELIERVARQLAPAIERVRSTEALLSSERQLRLLSSRLLTAQEEERKRIANELHDSIGSSISAIKFSLENSLEKLKPTPEVYKSVQDAVSITQDTLEEVRRIMADLHPAILDDLGIVPAIDWFCRRFQSVYTNIRIAKQVTAMEHEVPKDLKIVVFRVMQEAFHNIVKYSQAERVGLSFVKEGDAIELTITDDGIGFDPTALSSDKGEWNSGGLGLASMKERMDLSGGAFSISSSPGKGTTIRASWACPEPSKRNDLFESVIEKLAKAGHP
jgi:signal transduction histidine kinase/FixJ family two-component response regulator